ncbi:hypothetical protein [Bartonella sp. B30(2025)]
MNNTINAIHDELTLPFIVEETLKKGFEDNASTLGALKIAVDYHNIQRKHCLHVTFINSLNELKNELPEFTREPQPTFTGRGYHYLKDGILKEVMPLISKHGFFVYNPLVQYSTEEITLETTLMHNKSGHSISSRGTYSTIMVKTAENIEIANTATYQFMQEYAFEYNLCLLFGM